MQDYEIRIQTTGRTQTIIEMMHLNDHTAIRAAETLAAGRAFEVWRDLECIHGPRPTSPPLVQFSGARTH
ncbi:MAG TPA: hypothetical protein VJ750_12545 [Rhizomicrobium sp.]|nr:hypothetical protein [Rhizomicrobium sp.]